MPQKDKIDIGILIVSWYLRIVCLLYFVSLLFLVLFPFQKFTTSIENGLHYEQTISDLNVYQPILFVGLYFLGVGIGKKKEWARKTALVITSAGLVLIFTYTICNRTLGSFMMKANFLTFFLAALFFKNRRVKERFTWKGPESNSSSDR